MKRSINSYIDHTLLKADAKQSDILKLCQEAKEKHFAAVCIPPYLVETAKKELLNTDVCVASVVGFPFGYSEVSIKNSECKSIIDDGGDEIDAVTNISAIKSGNWDLIRSEIDTMTTTIRLKAKVFKLIFETSMLTPSEIEMLCKICIEFDVDYAKTSTGYGGEGANLETIKLMKDVLGNKVKIKASGGIKTLDQVKEFIAAGAERIGTSSAMSFGL